MTSAPSFCWICGRKLARYRNGAVYYLLVDQLGVMHRVHNVCAAEEKRHAGNEKTKALKYWITGPHERN